ncbi:MAG: acyl-CoA/acyl-ACP dehydrogenase [Candidatus Binatia bacterium]|nr:acyl-CoA/acyl-ACP dehydrogenase [Candidatus Binatia bacterium]
MDFSLTDEQNAISDLSGKILTDQATLESRKALEESSECIDRDAWAKLAQAGLIGIAIPEEQGGAGAGFVEVCLVLEQIGKAVSHVPFLPTVVYGALPLARFGSDEQKSGLLPGVAQGETLLTAALGEIGTDPRNPITTATKTAGGFRLDGSKIGVPIAEQAKRVLVPARLDGGGIAVFLVEPHAAGVRLEAQETFNWESHYKMTLDGVIVPASAVLGSTDNGAEVLGWILDRALTGLCAVATGVAQSAMQITAEYAGERKQFDKPIATFQAVSQRMGDCFIDNEAIGLTMWQAATRLADEMPSDREVATAKFWAGEGGSRIGHAALHVHGGISIDVDYPIQRYYLWAKQIEYTLGAGTAQLKRLGAMIAAE